jgi:Concanavalin A-like lectin/glucanases superfamily
MRKLILLLALSLVATVGSLPITNRAQALEASTVVANASSSWQTNGTVWALAYARGAIYLSGDFTSVRPPGAAAGTGEVARNHLAAFDASTGGLLPFNHNLNAKAWAMVPSADGSTLYIGGDFSTVDGVSRPKLAAFDTATGALTSWAPRVTGSIRGIALKGGTVYVGGTFSVINGQARKNLGAVSATGAGTPLAWAPTADLTVFRLAVAPDGSRVFAGGYFTVLNGIARRGTGALDPNTGATLPWASANVLPPHTATCTSDIRDIRVDASNVYFAAEGTGGGCFDGTFAARQSDGALLWKNTCLGATQAIEVIGSFLYKGSHAHDCSSVGAFPEVKPTGSPRHLLVERLSDGSLGPWYPNTNGNPLGPRAFATDGMQLFVGGDFGSVNNKAQQGFTRFGGPPDLTKPRTPNTLAGSSITKGQVRLRWQATTDDDDETLVYRVYRDGSTTPLFTSAPTRSTFWILPTLTFTDTGLTPGLAHTYRVDAKEAKGTNASAKSAAVSVTVASVDASYSTTVRTDSPFLYWRLGEASGTTAADASGNGRAGQYVGSVVLRQAGAISGDANTAVRLAGTSPSDGYVTPLSTTAYTNPRTFSVELWFKTSTTTGGKLIGFGTARTGTSTNYDRHIYMTNAGRLVFGVWTTSANTITTAASYNNNAYHHVVGTMGPSGMALYVDGALVGTNPTATAQAYNGFWRVGGDQLRGWPSQPLSLFFKGTVDEAAVYSTALSASQVSDHFTHRHG